MKRIHIIGRKNHGKTTLVAELVQELSSRGYRVGTIKHTHHQHELDSPGKDSHKHREAGAAVVGILTRSLNAVFWQSDSAEFATPDDRYEAFSESFANCQLTLVEGDTQTDAPKIEVWRESLGSEPLARTDSSIRAVVTHDEIEGLATPVWPRADIAAVADKIVEIEGIASPNVGRNRR
ncbi:MAG: molybdopterin-guanine dinucleotide biosynthesis protein B [Planctomycetes bacterium]|nr:molybdopterin-guanine dinucleotide biosynthesis protein B [Planctomycetota bacterium]